MAGRLLRFVRTTAMVLVTALVPFGSGITEPLSEEQGQAILEELRQIRQLLEKIEKQGSVGRPRAPQRPTSAKVSIKDRPAMGNRDAPVTLVEFADYECPFCHRFFRTVWPLIEKDYIDTGKLRVVVKDLPLGFHPNARKAAQASHCAAEQGKFWEMREVLYSNAQKLSTDLLPNYAKIVGLDLQAFKACLASERHLNGIDADAAEARSARLTGTPSFVVGRTASEEVQGSVIVGAQPYSVFKSRIDALLAATEK